jgi:hypothetical protein
MRSFNVQEKIVVVFIALEKWLRIKCLLMFLSYIIQIKEKRFLIYMGLNRLRTKF